jgi:hypothetical protein
LKRNQTRLRRRRIKAVNKETLGELKSIIGLVWFMVFNTTFNNISVISWWSVLLVEETEVPGENHLLVASH